MARQQAGQGALFVLEGAELEAALRTQARWVMEQSERLCRRFASLDKALADPVVGKALRCAAQVLARRHGGTPPKRSHGRGH